MIRKIVIDPDVFREAVEKAYEVPTEVGFYLIGIVSNDVAYVYDIVEFQYSEKSPVSVSAIYGQASMISAHLPIGLKVIGAMHKHPDVVGPMYSAVDRETFLNWYSTDKECIFIIFSHRGRKIKGYTVKDGEIVEIEVIIDNPPEIAFVSIPLGELSVAISRGVRPYDISRILEKELRESIKIPNRIGKLEFFEENRKLSFLQEIKYPSKLKLRKKSFVRVLYGKYMIPIEFTIDSDKRVSDLKEYLKRFLGTANFVITIDGEEIPDWIPISVLSGRTIFAIKKKPARIAKDEIIRAYSSVIRDLLSVAKSLQELKLCMKLLPFKYRVFILKRTNRNLASLMKSIRKIDDITKQILGIKVTQEVPPKIKTVRSIRKYVMEQFLSLLEKILAKIRRE